MLASPGVVAIDLGKSRCRAVTDAATPWQRDGDGAPGLAASDGVSAALDAIRPLLSDLDLSSVRAIGVGAAGAWAARAGAAELASLLAHEVGAPAMVASDVVTAHAGALGGGEGVLLIAGTGAAALGIDADGARLVDGWGPDIGDLGSGSWFGREVLRAVLRAAVGLAPPTVLTGTIAPSVGAASDIAAWLAQSGPLPRRLATLAPLALDAAAAGDAVARSVADEGIRLLTASAVAASTLTTQVALHGGLTQHHWFREALTSSLHLAGRRVTAAGGDALDGALLLARREDLPHERFVHRAE